MKLLDKLVYKDLLPALVFGVSLFASLWFAGGPIQDATKYLGMGIPWPIILHLVALSFAPVLSYTLPMGVLLAVLLGYGRLSGDSEAVALYASGIPFLRVMLPAAVVGLFCSGLGYVINDRIASAASAEIADIKNDPKFLNSQSVKPFTFRQKVGEQTLIISVEKGFDTRTNTMKQLSVVSLNARGVPTDMVQADEAYWTPNATVHWVAHNAVINSLGKNPSVFEAGNSLLKDLTVTPDDVKFEERDPDTLNFADLRKQIRLLRNAGQPDDAKILGAEVNLWSKIALPFSCLVFAMIGAPLGLRPQRSSKAVGGGLAILIIFAYYVLFTTMKSFAQGGTVPPILAAFLPDFLGVVAGAILSWKASQ